MEDNIVRQEMKFKYRDIEISSYDDIEIQVWEQARKSKRTAACLNNYMAKQT